MQFSIPASDVESIILSDDKKSIQMIMKSPEAESENSNDTFPVGIYIDRNCTIVLDSKGFFQISL